jgi:hypothetical protein
MRPNLFLIGAPKCGTSSLFDWLSGHPDIVGTRNKEPFFLIDPAHPLARRPNLRHEGIEAYEDLFEAGASQALVRMEGTTHYLFDPVARAEIASWSEARAILVLREPASRVYSSFRYTANNLARLSSQLSFARYLELIDRGEPLAPTWCRHAGSAYVLERDVIYSHYAQYVAPWLHAMGPERLRIVLMEEMIADPQALTIDLLTWLGLDTSRIGGLEEGWRNRTEQVRAFKLQAAARWLNARVRPPAPLRAVLKRAYAAAQYRNSSEMAEGDLAALQELRSRYGESNEELSRLTGLGLSVWRQVTSCQ